jgi:phosphoesterase RecJ-like protein
MSRRLLQGEVRQPSDATTPDAIDLIPPLIARANRILVVTHVGPDGDAVGSLLGLGWLLRAQGKETTLACEDPVPESCGWLPGSEQVVARGNGSYDLVISLDCSDPRRMGQVYEGAVPDAAALLVNIDHHITNTRFGAVNWVDPASVATAQMVLSLADLAGWGLFEAAAVCLLNGLVTDTRSFRTQNVDAEALRAALVLMEAGASLHQVTWRALEQRPLASVRMWGQAIDRMQLENGILWTEVTHEMRHHWQSGPDGESGLVNFLAGVREADVVVLFAERENGTVDVAMRAAPGHDVAQLALRLGGGGHPQAAGCTLEGGLSEVRQRVLANVRQSLASERANALL